MSEHFRPGGFKLLPPVVKNLLIINGIFFLATFSLGKAYDVNLVKYLGLHYIASDNFEPYQFVTYMFMHGDLAHIFFNMFALWMFGNVLENVWGPKRFLTYYVITGIGAAITHMIVTYFRIQAAEAEMSIQQISTVYNEGADVLSRGMNYTHELMGTLNRLINTPTVGASGAVFGILLAFGMMFPNSLIYLYFAIPIKAKYFVIIYGALELYMGISATPGDNIAHFAHLGGMIFGFFLIKYWQKR